MSRRTNRLLTGLAHLLLSLYLWGLNPLPSIADDSPSGVIELPQATGSSLELVAPARRIVTLSPHLAELVFEAGAGDLLVATVAYSDYPPEVSKLPLVGDAFRIDAERLRVLSPDLVLAWQSGNPAAALAQLTDLGLNVWSIEITQPREIAEIVRLIGTAAGTSERANVVAAQTLDRIGRLENEFSNRRTIRYFYQVAATPLFTINGEHLISRSLALCGGENIFADLGGLAPQVGTESVLLENPAALIAPDVGGPNPLDHWRSWPQLLAVQLGNLLLLPADEISRATPRMLNAVEVACRMLDDLRSP